MLFLVAINAGQWSKHSRRTCHEANIGEAQIARSLSPWYVCLCTSVAIRADLKTHASSEAQIICGVAVSFAPSTGPRACIQLSSSDSFIYLFTCFFSYSTFVKTN